MMHEIHYKYRSKAEFRRAVRKASWKNKWLRAIVGICITVAVIPVILFWITGGNQHLLGTFGGCIGVAIAMGFVMELTIHLRLRQSPGLLNGIQIMFDEEGLRETVPNEVEVFLPWSKVKNAFLDGEWFLIEYANSNFGIIPASYLSAEIIEYVIDRAKNQS